MAHYQMPYDNRGRQHKVPFQTPSTAANDVWSKVKQICRPTILKAPLGVRKWMILFQMIPLHTFVENFLPPFELTTEHINFWEQLGYTSAQTLAKRNVLNCLISLETVRAVNAAEMNRDSLCGQLNYLGRICQCFNYML